MDGVSSAASILAIAAAGLQISFKLIGFANQVSTGAERIRYIGTDVSLTAGVLQQLGDLMKKPPGEDERITIFSETGLTSTQAAADACRSVFEALEEALRKASRQIRRRNVKPGEKIVLSKAESLRWPFLQPNFDALGQELSSSRATLMLILQVTTLAYQKRLAELQRAPTMSRGEQEALISSIIAMQKTEREQLPGEASLSDPKIEGSQEQLLLSIPNDPPAPPSSLANPTRLPEVDLRQAGHPKPIEQHDQDHRAGHSTNSSCRQMLEEPPAPCSQTRTASSNLREISSTEPSSINKASLGDPSNDSTPAIEAGRDLQIWIFVPTVKAVYCGYKMTWLTKQLPVPAYEAQQEIHIRARKDERTLTEQVGSLTLKEREFLDAFVDGQIPGATAQKASGRSGAVRIELLGVIAEGTQVPYRHFEEIKTRDIIVIVRVRRSEPLVRGHAIGPEIFLTTSNTQDVFADPMGTKYTKIHSTYISPDVLNIYRYAWEWDKTDPYLILVQPLSQKQINKLVSTQRKIDGGTSSAEPGPSGFRFGGNILQKTHCWIRNVTDAPRPWSAQLLRHSPQRFRRSHGQVMEVHPRYELAGNNEPQQVHERISRRRPPAIVKRQAELVSVCECQSECQCRNGIVDSYARSRLIPPVLHHHPQHPLGATSGGASEMESLDRFREKVQGIGEWTNDEKDDIQGIPGKGTLDESISSDSDSSNEELGTTTHGDERMKIVEDYLARYTTLYEGKRAA